MSFYCPKKPDHMRRDGQQAPPITSRSAAPAQNMVDRDEDPLVTLSRTLNKVKSLQGECKEETMANLKDMLKGLDF